VNAKGKPRTVKFDAKFDSKDIPAPVMTVSIPYINERECNLTFKKTGKVVGKNDVSVSMDEKTTTVKEIFNIEATPGEKKRRRLREAMG
jgi:hypothetical protein